MSESESLFGKLKGRHVVRAAIAHVLVAWLFVQIADVVLPYLGIVDEPVRWALVISVGTFPLTLFIAWLTDEGRPVPELLGIVIVAAVAGWWASENLPEAIRERTSLVIMPFAHGDGGTNEGLSRALTQEIGSLLMRSRAIDVIGDESARSDLLRGLGTAAIAQRLNVGAVLSGSVATRDNSMRIELRLLSAAGEALWEATIEEAVANMFSVQERIASEIESRLGAGEDAVPVSQVAAERCWMPTDAQALREYYTARYYIEIRSESETSQRQIADAIELYEALLQQYPAFSDARSGLAWALLRQKAWFPEAGLPDDELGPRMRKLAQQAFDDCPTNGEALHILPNQYDHVNGWIGGYQQLSAFVELEPHKSENLAQLAGHFRLTGLADRAFATARRHVELNPLSVDALKNLAATEQYHGDLDVAAELYDRMVELGWQGPNFARMQQAANECAWDVDCMAERGLLWPALAENLELLRVATRKPSNEAERRESLDAAMAVYERNPADTVNTLNMMACKLPHLTPVFFEAWEAFKRDAATTRMNWFWPNGWVDVCADVWSDPRFVDYVEEAGFIEYWREVGWPMFCRPQGDSFACGRNISASQGLKTGQT
jgi:TolB-like protein